MNMFLWIVQGLLAVVFLGSGLAKSTMSRERLIATGQTGIALFPTPVVRFTAVCEVLAAVGLLLPWAIGIARALTPLAAAGLCIVMVGAASSHARLGNCAMWRQRHAVRRGVHGGVRPVR
jgi:hypothetical protein